MPSLAGIELDISHEILIKRVISALVISDQKMQASGTEVRFVRHVSEFRLECEDSHRLAVVVQLRDSSIAPYFDLAFNVPIAFHG